MSEKKLGSQVMPAMCTMALSCDRGHSNVAIRLVLPTSDMHAFKAILARLGHVTICTLDGGDPEFEIHSVQLQAAPAKSTTPAASVASLTYIVDVTVPEYESAEWYEPQTETDLLSQLFLYVMLHLAHASLSHMAVSTGAGATTTLHLKEPAGTAVSRLEFKHLVCAFTPSVELWPFEVRVDQGDIRSVQSAIRVTAQWIQWCDEHGVNIDSVQ